MSVLLGLFVSLVVFVLVCIVVVWLPSRRYSAAVRTGEAACGLVAALVGCLGLAYALFGPAYSFQSCSAYGNDGSTTSACQTGPANVFQIGLPPSALILLGLLVLGLIGVATSALLHSRTGGSWWQRLLWVATTIIVIMTFLAGFSISLFLLPSTLLALFASALSLGARRAELG